MHHFAVWAPYATACSVRIAQESYSMKQGLDGSWFADISQAHHGTSYAFQLDEDDQTYPDPRSAWQPDGVHGPSRVFDHSRYAWHDGVWVAPALADAIVYELHVGTFTPEGTFASAINKLPYLRDLGVTHVELMPVNSFPGRWGWGYDGVDLFAPQEQYGGPEGLKQLVDACHQFGLAALLDVVYNHFGPSGNYTGRFGPYTTLSHHTPWGGAMNLDEAGSVQVRRFFCDNALMWLRDYHFDGLRLDAIHAFVDHSEKHFLEQLSEEVNALSKELGRTFVLIAESDLNDPRVVTPRSAQLESPGGRTGYGIDAQWSDDFHHSLFAFLTGERSSYYKEFGSLAQIAKALKSVFVFDGNYSENRGGVYGYPVGTLSAHRFFGYIQNHDQVGNRAFGDRLHMSVGLSKAKLAAALVLTAPFLPMIFQGEEFASSSPFLYFADHDDPELAKAVSDGRRKEHAYDGAWDSIPDPETRESFEQSKLRWQELSEPDHAEMIRWYHDLIALRKFHPSLHDGNLNAVHVGFNEAQAWLTMKRGSLLLLFNFGEKPSPPLLPANLQVLLTTEPSLASGENGRSLPPLSFVAVSLEAK